MQQDILWYLNKNFPRDKRYWTFREYTIEPINNTFEYDDIYRLMNGHYHDGITGISYYENAHLYGQFRLKFEEIRTEHKEVCIRQLLHDTPICNLHSIASNNFDRRAIKRAKYGQGVSFAVSPDYAHRYSARKCRCHGYQCLGGIKRVMIFTDVIVGKCQRSSEMKIVPNNGYDTTVSTNGQVFVKYADNEYYPRYILFYMSKLF